MHALPLNFNISRSASSSLKVQDCLEQDEEAISTDCSSSSLLQVAGGGERHEVPDLEWATQEFAPVIKRGVNIPVVSHNKVPHTPRTPAWLGHRGLCSAVCTMLVVGNFPPCL